MRKAVSSFHKGDSLAGPHPFLWKGGKIQIGFSAFNRKAVRFRLDFLLLLILKKGIMEVTTDAIKEGGIKGSEESKEHT